MVDLTQLVKVKTPGELLEESAVLDALAYLKDTAWYVVNAWESEEPVPADISALRAEARKKIKDAKNGA